MAPRVIHAKVSPGVTGSDANRIYGPDWNADHTISGLTIGTDVQAHDTTLDALAAYNTNGLLAQTATDTFAGRTLTAPAAGISVSNGNGVSGNPTLALANDLSAVEGLAANGMAVRTATDTWTVRTITGTASQIALTNGDGVAGNPTISFSAQAAYTILGNATNGSAVPVAFTIAGLTHKASPTGSDKVMISDAAASDAFKYSTLTELVGAATVSGPGSSTNHAAARWNSTGGTSILDSALIIDDTTGRLSRSGNGGVPVQGTNTNDSASAGDKGEYVESLVSVLANLPSTATFGDVTSISLTAGDWDVTALVNTAANGATVSTVVVGISTTSGNSSTGLTPGVNQLNFPGPTAASNAGMSVTNYRMSLASTTTVYLKIEGVYTVATPQAVGRLSARRVR